MGSAHVESVGGADALRTDQRLSRTDRRAEATGERVQLGEPPEPTVLDTSVSPAEPTLTEGELFDLLSNRRRRYILHALTDEDGHLDVGTLSQEIAALEDDLAFEAVTSSDRKRVYTALQQSHLPKLDAAGVADFDRDRGTIQATRTLRNVAIYLDAVRGREFPWSDCYLGLTALVAIALAASTVSPSPFGSLPSAAWGVSVVVAFGVTALVHRYYS